MAGGESGMKSYNIGVLGGDGIGPEVMREGLKVLEATAEVEGFKYELVEYPYDSEHYLKTGELVPDSVIDEWRTLDAFLLGAIGHPDVEPGLVERAVILCRGGAIQPEDLTPAMRRGGARSRVDGEKGRRPSPEELQRILSAHGGNRTRAAQALGVDRTTLWRWTKSPSPGGDEL